MIEAILSLVEAQRSSVSNLVMHSKYMTIIFDFYSGLPHMFCFFPCQIGDFGMARDLANDSVYHSQGGKIPIKWTAPEVKTYAIFT